MSVVPPWPSPYGSSIAPVKFSRTPSIISLTLVARYRPIEVARRRSTNSSICSAPRDRSHHIAPTTRPVSSPREASATYARSSVVRLDDGVLPGGDPEPVQVALAETKRLLELGRRVVGHQTRRPDPSPPRGGCRTASRRGRARSGRRWGRRSSAVIPASSRAFEFTHAPCPSRFVRNAGRSGTTRSRSSRRGVPPSNAAMYQPPPRIQVSSGCERA